MSNLTELSRGSNEIMSGTFYIKILFKRNRLRRGKGSLKFLKKCSACKNFDCFISRTKKIADFRTNQHQT